jgi:hypothetical protein
VCESRKNNQHTTNYRSPVAEAPPLRWVNPCTLSSKSGAWAVVCENRRKNTSPYPFGSKMSGLVALSGTVVSAVVLETYILSTRFES